MNCYFMEVPRTPRLGSMFGQGIWNPEGWLVHVYVHPDYIQYLIEKDCEAFSGGKS